MLIPLLTRQQLQVLVRSTIFICAGFFLTSIAMFAQAVALDPASIESMWMKANRKYEPQRAAILKGVDQQIGQGPFRADWESLQKYQEPEWYKDAKFGIFIHWGIYSVPAFANEWYSRNMYIPSSPAYKHHVETYGPPEKFGYKDFVPMFRAEHFDANAWVDLFQRAGARYVVPVAEHCDGFAMYASDMTPWNAAAMGPRRDIVGELAQATRAHGLHFGISSHTA